MKYKKIIILIIAVLSIYGCGRNGSRLRVLGPECSELPSIKGLLPGAESITVYDTLITVRGIKNVGRITPDPLKPPVLFDFTAEYSRKEFDLADYYSDAQFVIIKHPQENQGAGFLDNIPVSTDVQSPDRNFRWFSQSSFFSKAYISGEQIVAGDEYSGYYCYDLSGKFLYTIHAPDELPDRAQIPVVRTIKPSDKWINGIKVQDENVILTIWSGYREIHSNLIEIHNTSRRSVIVRPFYSYPEDIWLVDDNTLLEYNYSIISTRTGDNYLYTYDIITGDTISGFVNSSPYIEYRVVEDYLPGDYGDGYYFDGRISLRQQYNDTVYRVTSPKTLSPAYILNMGDGKLIAQTDLYGDKSEKIIPGQWLETEDFVLTTYTYGLPSISKETKHFSFFYDKNLGKIFSLKDSRQSPLLFSSSERIFPMKNVKYARNTLYDSFTKSELKNFITQDNPIKLSKGQLERLKSLQNEIGEGEILLVYHRRKNRY